MILEKLWDVGLFPPWSWWLCLEFSVVSINLYVHTLMYTHFPIFSDRELSYCFKRRCLIGTWKNVGSRPQLYKCQHAQYFYDTILTIVWLQTSHLRPLTLSLLGTGLRGIGFSVRAPMQTKHGMCSGSRGGCHNTLKALPLSKVMNPHRAWWTGDLMKTRRDSNKSNMYINSNSNSTETQPLPFKCAMMRCYWNRRIVILMLLYMVIMLAIATEQKFEKRSVDIQVLAFSDNFTGLNVLYLPRRLGSRPIRAAFQGSLKLSQGEAQLP